MMRLTDLIANRRYGFEGTDNDDVMLGTQGLGSITGGSGNDYLLGTNESQPEFNGNAGNDIMQGLGSWDHIFDMEGNNILDGGAGADTLSTGYGQTNPGSSKGILIGGKDDDHIFSGDQLDVILFNKGDGKDILYTSAGMTDTVSLGGNFAYSDLSLSKSGTNLALKMGALDQINFTDWYAASPHRSVVNLQVIAEAIQGFSLGSSDQLRNNKVENFNFADIVTQFDTEGAMANWQLTDSRLTAHLLIGSDTAAMGGDLAYQYGKNSNLTGVGMLAAQSVLASTQFGQSAQALNSPATWQTETVMLG